MVLRSASRPRSDSAISVPASGCGFATITSDSMPLLFGSLRSAGGTAIGWPRARMPSRPKSNLTIWLTRSKPT